MTYCYFCGRATAGKPPFCNHCGRSYDVKLCPRLHENTRGAEVCSRCGSRELSTPQPRIPTIWRLLAIIARMGIGLLLFYLTLSLVIAFPRTPALRHVLAVSGAFLIGLWLLYTKLPDWPQEILRSLWSWKQHSDD
jgi:hypothetical protein